MQSRYGVCFGSDVQIGFASYALSGWRYVAAAALQPGVELLGFHHEAQEFLRRLRILRVLHDHLVEEQVILGRHADRADRERRVVDVGRQSP